MAPSPKERLVKFVHASGLVRLTAVNLSRANNWGLNPVVLPPGQPLTSSMGFERSFHVPDPPATSKRLRGRPQCSRARDGRTPRAHRMRILSIRRAPSTLLNKKNITSLSAETTANYNSNSHVFGSAYPLGGHDSSIPHRRPLPSPVDATT